MSSSSPLSELLRPRKPDDFVGQKSIWAKGALLRELVESDALYAAIFWGPPGVGKTSLAGIIGSMLERPMVWLSAVSVTVKELRETIGASQLALSEGAKAHILFVDEIHRLSKNQQDVLLPALEAGTVRFIGATTENPSFSVNNSILSRSMVFVFETLSEEDITLKINDALTRLSTGALPYKASPAVIRALAKVANGDLRRALNLVQAAVSVAERREDHFEVTEVSLGKVRHTFRLRYDRDGEEHYNIVSAMIKSIRASHPDAALYYMARMLEAGEDPLFVARRLLISASEDIGNANPSALPLAQAVFSAVQVLGMPEARIPLAQCLTYLACSPKSNRAYVAVNEALSDVRKFGNLEAPLHLRNAPTGLMKELGYGQNYAYAHDDPDGARRLSYLPATLKGRRYYQPTELGAEKQLKDNLKHLRPTGD